MLSCSSDSDGGGSDTGFYLKAKIDGANYANSSSFEPMATIAGGTLNIQSSNDGGDAIQIQVPNYTGVGTYNSGNNDLTQGYVNYLDTNLSAGTFVSYTSVRGTGQVIVTEVTDTAIKGTFTATVIENEDGSTNDKAITNGTFRVEL